MLVLLCLVVTYCCWVNLFNYVLNLAIIKTILLKQGTCCKVFQKRRQRTRSRSQMSFDSTGSWPSDPRLMSLWSPQSHSYEAPTSNRRETSRNDSRLSVETKPRWHHDVPPSYEVLFCPEMNFCSPPTYSSLELNQQLCSTGVSSNNPPTLVNELVANSSNPFVTVVIERESETTSDEQNLSIPKSVARFHRSQSVPASIGSSGQITHISVLFHTNNREA